MIGFSLLVFACIAHIYVDIFANWNKYVYNSVMNDYIHLKNIKVKFDGAELMVAYWHL